MTELERAVEEVIEASAHLDGRDRASLVALRGRGLRLENVVSFARRELQTRLDALALGPARGEEFARQLALSNLPSPPLARRHVELSLSEEDIALAEEAINDLAGPRVATEVSATERPAWEARQRQAEQTLSELRRRLHSALDAVSAALIDRIVADGEPIAVGSIEGVELPPPPGSEEE
ncbi:conserved hypothetical protein [Acidimicrobium ferrooxidans DSM 10331]|uniref:Uncharacterized protein n=1 Tax=Acidimicrobium ferrooxidans (strain DSM 10331 / JCM 15462 / NBRC 103882 / ICP) TaxID=525909 RepID=C7M2T3_ACIFD|nr:hypothetical protein [Acidimicrobium ferrooxidans]ACU53327.1 conserved hypothetical protein [Acidimicrobium ferrooxidans DSM 10331]